MAEYAILLALLLVAGFLTFRLLGNKVRGSGDSSSKTFEQAGQTAGTTGGAGGGGGPTQGDKAGPGKGQEQQALSKGTSAQEGAAQPDESAVSGNRNILRMLVLVMAAFFVVGLVVVFRKGKKAAGG